MRAFDNISCLEDLEEDKQNIVVCLFSCGCCLVSRQHEIHAMNNKKFYAMNNQHTAYS